MDVERLREWWAGERPLVYELSQSSAASLGPDGERSTGTGAIDAASARLSGSGLLANVN